MTLATPNGGRPLVLVAPLPPPFTGQSVSFEMLAGALAARGVPHRVVNLTSPAQSGTAARVLDYAGILARFARAAVPGGGTVYLTIAQSRNGFLRDLAIIRLARLLGHRVVAHLKGGNYHAFYAAQPPALQRLIRRTLLSCDRILVLGEQLRGMYDFEPRLASRIHVVPNGLPDRDAPSVEPKRLPGPGEGPVRLIFLSNLIESKGWLDVLEAVALLQERLGPGRVRCDFYGEFMANPADDVRVRDAEHARELFGQVVAGRGLGGSVAWHGSVSGERKREVLREAHLFLLPTRYSNEGQPVSIIEAMAYGTVVVSTRYRAIPDLVEDGVSGVMVPYGDPAALAEAIGGLVDEPGRFAALSRGALDRFARRFTREAHLATILPHLLGGPPARPLPAGEHSMAR